jgi:hypothetical protein
MKRLLWAALLTLVLPSLGCVGYHNGSGSSYSPGCYSCSRTREYHEDGHHRDHGRGHEGGGHHHHHDDDHDDHHHRHH